MTNTIKSLRKKLHLTQEEFAQRLGVSSITVQNWESGRNRPSMGNIDHICDVFDVSRSWLLTGEECSTSPEEDGLISYVYRPEIYASAGVGYLNESAADIEIIRLEGSVAERLGIRQNIEVIRVKGDSMEPKYSNGDMVFVDRGDRTFTSEGIYVILYMGTLMVKYLQRIQDGVRIRSYNRSLYDDIDMTAERFSQDDIIIIGKVRGAISFI
jgi:repressor LexA